MSRAYKDAVVDDVNKMNGAGTDITATVGEGLSGADLAQLLHAARNGAAAGATAGAQAGVTAGTVGSVKTLGTNPQYPGTPSNATLSGADLERTAGLQ